MNILFFISVYHDGTGGHFQSLNHISRKLAENNHVNIITIGPGHNSVIASNPHFYKHISFNGYTFFNLKKELYSAIKELSPDVYHCFDRGSYNVLRLFVSTKKHKVFINKCGGPNRLDFAIIYNIIVFSQENYNWFLNNSHFKDSAIYLIPNRVSQVLINHKDQPLKKDYNKFTFLRICRIGSTHKKSIVDSLALIEHLNSKYPQKVKLVIIGGVEDNDLYKNIRKHSELLKGAVELYTHDSFTKEASKFIYLADAVIGTGRSLMEAASLKKPVLSINANEDIPVLITKENFSEAFSTNFSARNVFFDTTRNIESIYRLVSDNQFYERNSHFILEMFERHFNIQQAVGLYVNAYRNGKFGKRKLLYDHKKILKSCWAFYKYSSKIK